MNDLIEQASLLMTADAMWDTAMSEREPWFSEAASLVASMEDDTPLFV